MSKQNLNVELREETGKGICRRLRSAGRVPGVVYGKGIEPVSISLETKQFSEAIAGAGGRNHILTLVGGGSLDGQTVIVCDMLQDAIKRTPRHVDLHRISLSDKVKVHVPVRLVGTAAGAKAGGMVDFAMHELEVECLPVHIPEFISVDVTELTIGHSIHVGEVPAPVGIAILGDPKAAVISILGRKAAEAEEAPAA